MRQNFAALGIFLILIGTFGISYTWNYDHRTTRFLDEYALLDFQTSLNGEGKLEGAVLSIWDFRFDDSKLLPRAILFTDNDPWEMPANVKNQRAKSEKFPRMLQNENKLFVNLPRSSLPAILMSKQIRFRFYYDNGQTIDLPLSEDTLKEWKRKMR